MTQWYHKTTVGFLFILFHCDLKSLLISCQMASEARYRVFEQVLSRLKKFSAILSIRQNWILSNAELLATLSSQQNLIFSKTECSAILCSQQNWVVCKIELSAKLYSQQNKVLSRIEVSAKLSSRQYVLSSARAIFGAKIQIIWK